MLAWLKKHFIPHTGNEHRPHFLRGKSARRVAVLIIAVELVVFLLPSLANTNLSGNLAAVISAVLDDLTNVERQSQNLPVLTVHPKLTLAAQMKADDMAENGYFAHTSPEGKTPWYWIDIAGYKYQYAGENLAVNFSDSEDVTKAWLESPTHKANIVKGNYTEMGTGIARGIYKGSNTVFVAQVYANPMPQALPFPVTLPIRTVEAAPTPAGPAVTSAERVGVLGTATEATPPVEQNTVEGPTLSQKLLASPRNTANTLLVIIFAAVAIALILYAAIKVRDHHLDIIGNGLLLLAIIGAILVANYYFSYRKLATTSTDYSREENLEMVEVKNKVEQNFMKIESEAFENNGRIPEKYTCSGEGQQPPLKISGVPEAAKSLALIVNDPDAPSGDFVHWLVWNIDPKTSVIPDKENQQATTIGAMEGNTSVGSPGWVAPCPPSGAHHYNFKLYALDTMLSIPASADKTDLMAAMSGHVLDNVTLTGLYGKE